MKRNGVVMVLAITMMGLSTALMTALACHANIEARRTMMAGEDAQVGQLMTAAIQIAGAHVTAGQFETGVVASPAGKITLNWQASANTATRTCTIDVAFGNTNRSMVYVFKV